MPGFVLGSFEGDAHIAGQNNNLNDNWTLALYRSAGGALNVIFADIKEMIVMADGSVTLALFNRCYTYSLMRNITFWEIRGRISLYFLHSN